MSNTVKSRFAGLLRSLLRRMDDHDEVVPASAPRPVAAAAPLPTPPAAPTGPAPSPTATNSDEMTLPLAPIVAGLPMELRAKIMTVPPAGMTINLPVETVASQLAFGAVKISFGELRQLAPGIFANSGGELDHKMIALPLGEILSRMNPTLLARRAKQKVEVDSEISGPFGARGGGVSFTTQPLKPSPAPAAPAFTAPPRVNTPATVPSPIAFTPPPSFEFPTKPANGNGHRVPPPSVPPAPPVPPVPVVLKVSAAPAPVPPASASAPVPPAPAAPRPEPAQPTIFASLWDLAENWPGELKQEILASSLANENVPLAGALVEAGLKRGRVTLSWKQLRTLAKPSSAPSVNDELELELSLKVIAPLFFAAQKKLQGSRKKAAVSDDIPNLFFGFPQAMPLPPVSAPKPVEKKSADSNFYVWGDTSDTPNIDKSSFAPPPVPHTDFTSRQAQPKDVVARAKALSGVVGAVVTLPDGLHVASEVPAEFNADTLAAFIPQLFERMNQSARELRMGALNNVSFTVGNVPWRIYRVNAVYLAAFGRAGESLPAADLAALAGELDRKKQP
jgi:predicted regulator of Ras-like GTPase activity (Roadblock/LC7/MglB family)